MNPNESTAKGDASIIVDAFRRIADAFLTMANIRQGEAHTWGIYLARHAPRERRNRHRMLSARLVAEATRSEDAWGSHEAAAVARGNPPTPGGMLDQILETALPTKAPTPAGQAAAPSSPGRTNGGTP